MYATLGFSKCVQQRPCAESLYESKLSLWQEERVLLWLAISQRNKRVGLNEMFYCGERSSVETHKSLYWHLCCFACP